MNPGKPHHIGATADGQTLGGQTNQRSINKPTATDAYNQNGFISGAQGMSFSGRRGNSYVQQPSMEDVRQIVVSQPSGTGDHYAYGQPPSISDVCKREGSQSGPSFAGNPGSGAEALPGMSLTASSFRMHNPNAFKKDNYAT